MSRKQIKSAISAAILGILSPLSMLIPASAATTTWAGHHPLVDFDGKTSTASNWLGAVAPVNTDTVVFGVDGINQTIGNDISSLTLVKIIFSGEFVKAANSNKNYVITGNGFTITSGIDAIMTGVGGDQQVKTNITLGAAATFKTTTGNTLSVGDTATILDLSTHALTLDAGGGTITLLGKIVGSGNIVKSGSGKVDIKTTPGTGGYTGALTVGAGETAVNEVLGLNVTVSGGTLKGTGTVGTVTMSSGAVAPGNSPGVLNTGNLTYTGGAYNVELGGTTAGSFDQTNVTGTVTLGTATDLGVSVVNSFAPKVNDSFVIINNDGTDAVSGNFKGLADGDNVTLGSYTYQINYDGGSGNDVVLLVLGTPSAPYTGVGSLITSPTATFIAAIAVLVAIGGIRVAELKKAKVRS